MSGGSIRLRTVTGWMAGMLVVAGVAVAHVKKQHAHATLSREVAQVARARDGLAAEILLLETETRGLRRYARIEAVARERLGMINPVNTVALQRGGQVVAANARPGADTIRQARWRFFR